MAESEVPNAKIWQKLLEAERHVDSLANQPKSLAVLHEAIETVARAKGVALLVMAQPSLLHVLKDRRYFGAELPILYAEISIALKGHAFHVYDPLGHNDLAPTVLQTLKEAAWYVVTGSTGYPSRHIKARRKLQSKEATPAPGPNGFISFDHMARLPDDDN